MSRKKNAAAADHRDHADDSGGTGPAPEAKAISQVWQARRIFEMNVYLLRNTGLDLQRWFEREVQALTGKPATGGQSC